MQTPEDGVGKSVAEIDFKTYPEWCPYCQMPSKGHLAFTGLKTPPAYVPGCSHDTRERRIWQLLREAENHCPCGARPESPVTHGHVIGCPIGLALDLVEIDKLFLP